jgi:hypothetical protein
LRISWCRVHVTLPEKFWFTNPAILHRVPLILELSHMLVKVRLLLTHFWHQICLLVLIISWILIFIIGLIILWWRWSTKWERQTQSQNGFHR